VELVSALAVVFYCPVEEVVSLLQHFVGYLIGTRKPIKKSHQGFLGWGENWFGHNVGNPYRSVCSVWEESAPERLKLLVLASNSRSSSSVDRMRSRIAVYLGFINVYGHPGKY
jgi:hypothetical protein